MSDAALPVLLALRLRSFSTVEVVAERSGLEPDVVAATLDESAAAGWATHRDGRVSGWSLTADGRRRGEALLSEELDATGTRTRVTSSYESFLTLNGELLAVCTDWQVVEVDGDQRVNDHADPAHDAAVLERLDALHAGALPITDDLGAALGRFGDYSQRLTTAHQKVRSGDHDWLTKPVIDSYHTVWFELHEDLLATLGRERSQERT